MALITDFYWQGRVRQIGKDGLEWPDLPGWTDDELVDAMPGGVPPAMRLPGNWWHCFLHTAPHQERYQAKIKRTAVIRSENELPATEHEVDEWDETQQRAVKRKRALRVLAGRIRYGRTP